MVQVAAPAACTAPRRLGVARPRAGKRLLAKRYVSRTLPLVRLDVLDARQQMPLQDYTVGNGCPPRSRRRDPTHPARAPHHQPPRPLPHYQSAAPTGLRPLRTK